MGERGECRICTSRYRPFLLPMFLQRRGKQAKCPVRAQPRALESIAIARSLLRPNTAAPRLTGRCAGAAAASQTRDLMAGRRTHAPIHHHRLLLCSSLPLPLPPHPFPTGSITALCTRGARGFSCLAHPTPVAARRPLHRLAGGIEQGVVAASGGWHMERRTGGPVTGAARAGAGGAQA